MVCEYDYFSVLPLCIVSVNGIHVEFYVNGAPWRSGKEYHPSLMDDLALLFIHDLSAPRDYSFHNKLANLRTNLKPMRILSLRDLPLRDVFLR